MKIRGLLKSPSGNFSRIVASALSVGLLSAGLLGVGATAAQAGSGDTLASGWGSNGSGRLGDGTLTSNTAPQSVSRGGALTNRNVTSVSARYYHSCATTDDGTAACWGYNPYGQLGNGTVVSSSEPVAANTGALTGKFVTDISVGLSHTCALTSDGIIACWGWNGSGELGNGTVISSSVPVAVKTDGVLAGKKPTSIHVGDYFACATTDSGVIACWGYNPYGGLGNGTFTNSSVPVAVKTDNVLSGKTPAVLGVGGYHACTSTTDGTVACWGASGFGQLGNNSVSNSSVPVAVNTLGALSGKTVTSIAAHYHHTCVTTSVGSAACWGANGSGQLGNGSYASSSVPVASATGGALSGKTLTSISAGWLHTCATASDGTAACWGANGSGQLGNGSYASSSVPVAVSTLNAGPLGARPLLSLSAGSEHTGAVYGFAARPGAPTSLAISGTPTTLTWTAPSYTGGDLTDYGVYYRINGGSGQDGRWKLFARGIPGTTFDLAANAETGCSGASDCRRLHGPLADGVAYDFQVLGFTSVGNGKSPDPITHTWGESG